MIGAADYSSVFRNSQGEKLFEELHVDGERHLPTSHTKIMVAQGDRMKMVEVLQTLERLSGTAEK